MKDLFFTGCLVLFAITGFSQLPQAFSIEGGLSYVNYQYKQGEVFTTSSSGFGLELMACEQIGRVKISLGVNPNTVSNVNNDNCLDTNGNEVEKFVSKGWVSFWQLHVTVGIREGKDFNVNFSTGLTVAFVSDKTIQLHYVDGSVVDQSSNYLYDKSFAMLHTGLVLQKKIDNNIWLVCKPGFDWRFTYPNQSASPGGKLATDYPQYLPEIKSAFNLKIGVNYILSRVK
jgi:hypothetical protein